MEKYIAYVVCMQEHNVYTGANLCFCTLKPVLIRHVDLLVGHDIMWSKD